MIRYVDDENNEPVDISRVKLDEFEIDEGGNLVFILSIFRTYFNFKYVKGIYTPYVVRLDFDNFSIRGAYNCSRDTFDANLFIGGQNFSINFHPFGGFGELCTQTLEEDLKRIKTEIDKCSFCVAIEDYVVFTETLGSVEELNRNIDFKKAKTYIVYGEQLHDSLIGETRYGQAHYREL